MGFAHQNAIDGQIRVLKQNERWEVAAGVHRSDIPWQSPLAAQSHSDFLVSEWRPGEHALQEFEGGLINTGQLPHHLQMVDVHRCFSAISARGHRHKSEPPVHVTMLISREGATADQIPELQA